VSKGIRVRLLEQIQSAALNRRAVIWNGLTRPKAAAFVISMQARTVLSLMRRGMWIWNVQKKKGSK
jgi:hypothetical protein